MICRGPLNIALGHELLLEYICNVVYIHSTWSRQIILTKLLEKEVHKMPILDWGLYVDPRFHHTSMEEHGFAVPI